MNVGLAWAGVAEGLGEAKVVYAPSGSARMCLG